MGIKKTIYFICFLEILNEEAWPGTLNVKVMESDLSKFIAMREKSGIDTLGISDSVVETAKNIDLSNVEFIRVRGFLRDGKSFGGATAINCNIKTSNSDLIPSAILIPDLTRHVDVIEIISTKFLRERITVSDGDLVTIEIDV